jgi:hypothetical protein
MMLLSDMSQPQWVCGGLEYLAFLPFDVPSDRMFSVLNYKSDTILIEKNQTGNLMLKDSVRDDWINLEKALMLVCYHLAKASNFWTESDRSWLMQARLPVHETERFHPFQYTLFFPSRYCYDQPFFKHKDEILVKTRIRRAWQGFRSLSALVTFLIHQASSKYPRPSGVPKWKVLYGADIPGSWVDELGRSTVARSDSCLRFGAYVDIKMRYDLFVVFVSNSLPTIYKWTDEEAEWAKDDGVGVMAFRPTQKKSNQLATHAHRISRKHRAGNADRLAYKAHS